MGWQTLALEGSSLNGGPLRGSPIQTPAACRQRVAPGGAAAVAAAQLQLPWHAGHPTQNGFTRNAAPPRHCP